MVSMLMRRYGGNPSIISTHYLFCIICRNLSAFLHVSELFIYGCVTREASAKVRQTPSRKSIL